MMSVRAALPLLPLWVGLSVLGGASSAQAAGTGRINDTGMVRCVDTTTFNTYTSCTGSGQDGEFGRDVKVPNQSDGRYGFKFRKVCNSGELAGTGACPTSAAYGTGANEWGCTKDVVTGLTWELKIDALSNFRDWRQSYYQSSNTADINAVAYMVSLANMTRICGSTGWRLPTRQELVGLVNYMTPWPGPAIDTRWFPDNLNLWFWSSTPWAEDGSYYWAVGFSEGRDDVLGVSTSDGEPRRLPVRLVRAK